MHCKSSLRQVISNCGSNKSILHVKILDRCWKLHLLPPHELILNLKLHWLKIFTSFFRQEHPLSCRLDVSIYFESEKLCPVGQEASSVLLNEIPHDTEWYISSLHIQFSFNINKILFAISKIRSEMRLAAFLSPFGW